VDLAVFVRSSRPELTVIRSNAEWSATTARQRSRNAADDLPADGAGGARNHRLARGLTRSFFPRARSQQAAQLPTVPAFGFGFCRQFLGRFALQNFMGGFAIDCFFVSSPERGIADDPCTLGGGFHGFLVAGGESA